MGMAVAVEGESCLLCCRIFSLEAGSWGRSRWQESLVFNSSDHLTCAFNNLLPAPSALGKRPHLPRLRFVYINTPKAGAEQQETLWPFMEPCEPFYINSECCTPHVPLFSLVLLKISLDVFTFVIPPFQNYTSELYLLNRWYLHMNLVQKYDLKSAHTHKYSHFHGFLLR